MRTVGLKNGPRLQWTRHFDRRQTHENLTPADSVVHLAALFGDVYRNVCLFTTDADVAARVTKSGDVLVTQSPPSKQPADAPQAHDRRKLYLIPEGAPVPFLIALGVMTSSGHVRKAKQHKFRQINRYLEFANDVYGQLPADGRLEVVDFGCGLSYLTFALHHLLSVIHGREVRLRGIDRSKSVIARCRQTADDLDLHGLEFTCGDIGQERPLDGDALGIDVPLLEADSTDSASSFSTACPPEAVPNESPPRKFGSQAVARDTQPTGSTPSPVHLAVSLHACDTATDDALAAAVRMGANVILAAPCCQHELFTQLDSEALSLLTQHGILKERFAALATDALRAAILEQHGYRTQVIEFIDTEHTPKNLLLRAIRRKSGPADTKQPARTTALKQLLGIGQTRLESLLTQNDAAAET